MATQIGKRLKKARAKKRLTQEEVAKFLDIGRAAYANIETGRSLITVEHLLKLPQILGGSITYFLGVSDGDLTQDESEALELFRAIPPGQPRRVAIAMLRTWVEEVQDLSN